MTRTWVNATTGDIGRTKRSALPLASIRIPARNRMGFVIDCPLLLVRLRIGGRQQDEAAGTGAIRAAARQRPAPQDLGGRVVGESGGDLCLQERVAKPAERLVSADERHPFDSRAAGPVVEQDEK